MPQTVELDAAEWQQVLAVLGGSTGFPWTLTNPLLMKIAAQLQDQRPPGNGQHAGLAPD